MPNIAKTLLQSIKAGIDDAQYETVAKIWTTNATTINLGGTSGPPATNYEGWFRFDVSAVPIGVCVTSVVLRMTLNNCTAQTQTISVIIGDANDKDWTLGYPNNTFYPTTTNWTLGTYLGDREQTSPAIPAAITMLNSRPFITGQSWFLGFKLTNPVTPSVINKAYAYEAGGNIAGVTVNYYQTWKHRRPWGERHTWAGWSRPAKQRLRCRYHHERHLLLPD